MRRRVLTLSITAVLAAAAVIVVVVVRGSSGDGKTSAGPAAHSPQSSSNTVVSGIVPAPVRAPESTSSADSSVTIADGGKLSIGGATLMVPPGAVDADGRLVAHTAGAPTARELVADAQAASLRLAFRAAGTAVSFAIEGAHLVHPAKLTLPIDRADLPQDAKTASRPDVIWLAFYDPTAGHWSPVASQYDAATHTVSAEIPHLTWWQPWTWDWSAIEQRLNAALKLIGVSRRADPQQCPPESRGVHAAVTPIKDQPLFGCASADASSATVDLTNNRAYGMLLQAPAEASLQPLQYTGFMQWVETRSLVTKALGAPYLSPGVTGTYKLRLNGPTVHFAGRSSWKTTALDFGVMIIKSLALKAVEFGGETVGIPGLGVFADCVLESVANSQPLSLREAPSLAITCLSNIGEVLGIGSVQFWMQEYFSYQDQTLDYWLDKQGAVTVTRPAGSGQPATSAYNTSYTSTCGGAAPHPFTVNVQNGKGTAPGSPQHYDVQVEAVKHGDLTGDGRPETAVLLVCTPEPSNYSIGDVQVFWPDNKLLAELPHTKTLRPPDKQPPQYVPSELSIDTGQLIAGMKFYAPTDSHASGPSEHRTLTWRWNGNTFVLSGGGVGNVSPTADVLALLQNLAMQNCQSNPSYASECTPGGAKVSKTDPRYGVGIANATGGHGTIFRRPSPSSTAFAPAMNIGGDVPGCSEVQAAGVPSAVFTELLGQPCRHL